MAGGARRMHQWTKLHPKWVPELAVQQGVYTSSPQAVVEAQFNRFNRYLQGTEMPDSMLSEP
eukprot:3035224-Prorocentrum_lima.AAC.1